MMAVRRAVAPVAQVARILGAGGDGVAQHADTGGDVADVDFRDADHRLGGDEVGVALQRLVRLLARAA